MTLVSYLREEKLSNPIIIDVQANTQQAQDSINQTNAKIKETEKVTADVSTASASKIGFMAAAWQKGLDFITNSLKSMIDMTKSSMVATARLDAVHKATAATTGMSKDSLDALTKSLVKYTGATTTEVKNAQAVLLTFQKVAPESFDRAQKAAGDLSALLQTDLKSAMAMVGKALEDPINGTMALRKAGIILDDETKKQIKTLTESNRLREAQALILTKMRGVLVVQLRQ